jgi:hypothetical protein
MVNTICYLQVMMNPLPVKSNSEEIRGGRSALFEGPGPLLMPKPFPLELNAL